MQSLSSFRKVVSNRSMGIEIECLLERFTSATDIAQTGNYLGFFYVTTDGSIDSDYDHLGREFVSQPLPASWLRKEIQRLGKKVAWTDNPSCGIHIHVSKTWLSVKKAAKIQEFYTKLDNSNRHDLFGRASNYYCRDGTAGGRYKAINTTNDKTIEFRMFSSGPVAWAQYCTHLVEYLINNANHLNVDAAYAASDMYRKQCGL
jgi:hypothetical protein